MPNVSTGNPLIIDVGEVWLADRTVQGDAVTYGTPKKACTAASIKAAYTKGKTVVYESGVAVLNRPYVSGADVTIQTSTMSLADRMSLYYNLTASEDGEYEEGGDQDVPAEKALGYWFALSDGSYLCTWWYYASAQPADEGGETSDDSGPKITPDDIIISCVKDPILRKRRRTKVCKTAQERDAFFAAVQKKVS